MINVRIVSNYASSETLVSEIIRQFKPIIGSPINWVYDDSYDLLFICNNWDGEISVPKKQIYVLAQEPQWSDNYKDWRGECAEFIAPVNENYPLMFFHHGLSWQEVDQIAPVKTKNLSFICAKGEPKEGTLYNKRNELFLALLESYIDIDLYGRGWGNLDHPKFKGELTRKSDGLIDYTYSICCENSYHHFYQTEKLYDIIACKAIPIVMTWELEYYNINDVIKHLPGIMDPDYLLKYSTLNHSFFKDQLQKNSILDYIDSVCRRY